MTSEKFFLQQKSTDAAGCGDLAFGFEKVPEARQQSHRPNMATNRELSIDRPRILIVRLSAIGDVVMASGLVPALRARWPHAHLTWMVEPSAAPLLVHNPHIDHLIIWPRSEWKQLWVGGRYSALWQRFISLRSALRAGCFDIAIDAQGLLKSALWTWLSGARRRIGLVGREGSSLFATERVPQSTDNSPRLMGAEYRHLARYLGAADDAFQPSVSVGGDVRRTVNQLIRAELAANACHVGTDIYVVLCPFTTRAQKHWFEERWGVLARKFREAGLAPVLLGGPADRDAADRIASGAHGIVNLVGVLRLDESVAAIAGAALLIGVDTGLTHIGSALSIPTVALFGSTRPYLDANTPRSKVLFEDRSCSPCHRHPTCNGRHDCMRDLEVDRVFLEANRMMERSS